MLNESTEKWRIVRSIERGSANYGWLKTHYSFSFANYYNPKRMGFGALRVLNDDVIAPGTGFPFHSHKDMEIITIPLSGELEHKDTEGGHGIITENDVQIMSAGTGITHSEYNHSTTAPLSLFQIWIEPEKKNLPSRYEQKTFPIDARKNSLQVLVSPHTQSALKIFQDATISRIDLSLHSTFDYGMLPKNRGLSIMIIDGECVFETETLSSRDSLEIEGPTSKITLSTASRCSLLLIEVPLNLRYTPKY